MRSSLLLLIIIMIGLVPLTASGSVPPLLNYQGILRDGAGDPVPDGNYSVTFRIWDSETSGTALWQEGRLVAVQDGLLSVLLGSIVPIPDTLFSNPNRWIGLQVGLDAEMSPRQRLVSVPFAWHSLESDKSDTAAVALVVDTTGYSAYADLLSEGRIGNQAGQLATGDHAHALGELRVLEDTATVIIPPTSGPSGNIVLKSLVVPSGQVGHYLRIMAVGKNYPWFNGALSTRWSLLVDGVEIYAVQGSLNQSIRLFQAELFRRAESPTETWIRFCNNECMNAWLEVPISLNDGATISLVARAIDSGTFEFEAYELIVLYDAH